MKKYEVILTDDIDGTQANETVKFAYRGKAYEIDLNQDNMKKFDDCMRSFVSHARSTGSADEDSPTTNIRTWAKSRGLKVGTRGRIPANILREYYQAVS